MLANWDEKSLKEIEQAAYFKWIDAGHPEGMQQHFWQLAEKEMLGKTVGVEEIVEINYRKPHKKLEWDDKYYGSIKISTTSTTIASNNTSVWHVLDDYGVYVPVDRVAHGSRNPSPSRGNNEVPVNNPPPVWNDGPWDLSGVSNKGNDRYKVYDRDLRQTLSDNAIKEIIQEQDEALAKELGIYWGE